MKQIKHLRLCIQADVDYARRLADRCREQGEMGHAAILQRAADDMQHVLHDLRVLAAAKPETVNTCWGEVVVGGEG